MELQNTIELDELLSMKHNYFPRLITLSYLLHVQFHPATWLCKKSIVLLQWTAPPVYRSRSLLIESTFREDFEACMPTTIYSFIKRTL